MVNTKILQYSLRGGVLCLFLTFILLLTQLAQADDPQRTPSVATGVDIRTYEWSASGGLVFLWERYRVTYTIVVPAFTTPDCNNGTGVTVEIINPVKTNQVGNDEPEHLKGRTVCAPIGKVTNGHFWERRQGQTEKFAPRIPISVFILPSAEECQRTRQCAAKYYGQSDVARVHYYNCDPGDRLIAFADRWGLNIPMYHRTCT